MASPLERSPFAALLFALTLSACQAPPAAAPCAPGTGADATGSPSAGAPAVPRRLVIENSELIDLHSEQTGRDYELIVGLPESYAKESQRRYPVLYLLDGQWDFNIVNQMAGALRYDKVIPEILIVGITYSGDEPNYTELRRADYTPSHWQPPDENAPFGGDGPKFLSFLQEKLLPTVEAHYRVDASQRMLAGHSAGGLFTLYALLEKPDLFQSYLALSPATFWGDRLLFQRERQFHAQHPSLQKRIWMSVGELEWPDYVRHARDFFSQFEASHYQGIALRTQIVPGERHAGVKPEAFNRALRFVFEPWAAQQPRE